MKKLYFTAAIFILLVSISNAAELPEFAADLPELKGGVGGINIGFGGMDITDLNSKLSEHDMPSITENYAVFGFEAYAIVENWLLGGRWLTFTVKETDIEITETNGETVDSEMHILGQALLVKGGYIVFEKNHMRVYPMLGIGYGNLSLTINEKRELTLDEILNEPHWNGFITEYGFLVDISIGFSHILEFERTGHSIGPMIGVNIGYIHSFDMDFNGTDVGFSGPYFNITIGLSATDK